MSNYREYTEEELETKLDSLMNEDEDWLKSCFGDDVLAEIEDEKAQIKKEQEKEAKKWTMCKKCNGKGHIMGYAHISGGVCFSCMGSGKKRR